MPKRHSPSSRKYFYQIIMKTRILFLLTLCLCGWFTTSAQNAKSTLDTTANKLKKAGGIEASFIVTYYKGNTPAGNAEGTICVERDRFKVKTDYSTTWFDGKTQWALVSGSDEAYVSIPTPAELQSINPYSFVNLYQSGYSLSQQPATYSGKSCHEVRLVAQNQGASILEMILTIDPSTSLPLCVRVKQKNGNWVRITITGIHTGRKWKDSFFKFNQKEYPQVEVIDLR